MPRRRVHSAEQQQQQQSHDDDGGVQYRSNASDASNDAEDAEDEADADELLLSPVCTWCVHWKPGDGRHCAGAYPRDGAPIPLPIWRGAVTHVRAYPSAAHPTDHGVHFDLHPRATLAALKRENPTLYAAYVARLRTPSSAK